MVLFSLSTPTLPAQALQLSSSGTLHRGHRVTVVGGHQQCHLSVAVARGGGEVARGGGQ